MKRLLSVAICFVLFFAIRPVPVLAESFEAEEKVSVTVFSDGSYCVTTVTVLDVSPAGTRSTVTGTKTNKYYNSNGVLQFSVHVVGTFTYNGTTATATESQYGYRIYDSSWSFYNGFSSCSGATATATCTFSFSDGGHRTESASLTCSPSGVLS